MRRDLDREEVPMYSIIVKASSNRSWTPVRAQRASWARALDPGRDPTLQEVNVYLEDVNDQSPRFVKKEYTAGVCRFWSVVCHVPRVLMGQDGLWLPLSLFF